MRLAPRSRFSVPLVLVTLLLVSACADEEPAEPETGADEPIEAVEPEPAAMEGARVGVAQEEPYGTFLADVDGRPLYLFTADTQGQSSACYDACATAWPPLLTTGDPRAAAPAVEASMLGTVERRDGAMQVTYNGWPLYYYQQDPGSGEVTGQDVHSFGGEWYLVSPEGATIEAESDGA